MSNVKFMNIIRLMTTYNLEISDEILPDNLKCVKCKLVLKDASQGPCGCRFCLTCIDDVKEIGGKFCPGVSEDCGESLLSDFVTDFKANKNISKLIVKCPQNGCVHECELAELEEHMRVCGRKSVTCPFHEFGCQQNKLAAEEMSLHFQQENRSHSEILIWMIADINREMESYKREIEMLKSSDETNKKKIEMLERSDESNKMNIEMLKHELVLKDGKMRTILDQMGQVENENKSIKNYIKLIKAEKADFTDRVWILSEKIKRDVANTISHVDKEIKSITTVIGSNKDEVDTVMKSVENDIRSLNQDSNKLINYDIDFIKSQVQSIQALATLMGLGQVDASYEWTIDEDVRMTNMRDKTSDNFSGVIHPYKYRLSSYNYTSSGELAIRLYVLPGTSDSLLEWLFSWTVTITVADKYKRHLCQIITRQCEINRPSDIRYSSSAAFKFSHSSLIESGLDLALGVRVSCVIAPTCAG